MWLFLTRMAEANSGSGSAAVAPMMEFFISIIATIIGGVIVLAILFKGAYLLFSHDRENIGGWVVGFLFGVALIAGAKPIAAGVTSFAGAMGWETLAGVRPNEIVGYVLGDVLWQSLTLGVGLRWQRLMTRGDRHGD